MKTNLKYFKKKFPFAKIIPYQLCSLCIANMLAMPRTCAKWDGCCDHWKKGHEFAKARKAREAREKSNGNNE